MTVVLVPMLRTRTPDSTDTLILLEDRKPALGMCIEVESGKGDAAQP